MIYSVEGRLDSKQNDFVVIVAAGVGYKVFVGARTAAALPAAGSEAKMFCHHRVSDNDTALYGFTSETELSFFELLLSVSGVGPKSALAILEVADLKSLAAAIKEGRPDLLIQASGIGRRTAERIIVELRDKVSATESASTVRVMETDADLVEALLSLGYRREEARAALSQLPSSLTGTEVRLKAALQALQRK